MKTGDKIRLKLGMAELTCERLGTVIAVVEDVEDIAQHPSGDGYLIVHREHPVRWLHNDGTVEVVKVQ